MHITRMAYSIGDAAAVLGISRSYAYSEIASGRLRSFHAGRRHMISSDAIRDYITARERESQGSYPGGAAA